MKNVIDIILCMVLALAAISCNDLNYDLAEKKGVKLLVTKGPGISGEVKPDPDSVSAFFWPSEQYFEGRQKRGLEEDHSNYQSYIEQVAATVFLASDEFDEWSLRYLYEGKGIERSLDQIAQEEKPFLAQIRGLSRTLRDLKKQSNALKKLRRKTQKEIDSQTRKVTEGKTLVEGLESSLRACLVSSSGRFLSRDDCQEVKSHLSLAQEDLVLREGELSTLSKTKTDHEGQFQQITTQTKETYNAKKALGEGRLSVLKKQKQDLGKKLEEMMYNQVERVSTIQMALDPYAVSFEYDGDGNILLNEFGRPQKTINDEAQVNWIKVYQNSPGEDNEFDIGKERIVIRLGAWGEHRREYKTTYQKNEQGQWELSPDSSIYDVNFSSDEMLKFKFQEKDVRENLTGRIFEFKLQRSPFGPLVRFAGDIVVTLGGRVMRRGQMKVLLPISH